MRHGSLRDPLQIVEEYTRELSDSLRTSLRFPLNASARSELPKPRTQASAFIAGGADFDAVGPQVVVDGLNALLASVD